MRARLTVLSTISSQLSTSASHCFFADLFRTNAHCVFHRKNEYFSIANLARLGCGDYHIDRPLHHVVCHHHFHFYFWQEIHRVLAPPVDFSVSFLPAKPFTLILFTCARAEARKAVASIQIFQAPSVGFELTCLVNLLKNFDA